MIQFSAQAEAICRTGRWLCQRGFVAATEGNLSCRLPNGHVLCTPTMVNKGQLTPQDLCEVDLDGRQHGGERPRTSEVLLHLEIYKHNRTAAAVVHCHPPYATAFAISASTLPKGLLAEAEYFLRDIPTLPYRMPGTSDFASLIAPHAVNSRCAILKNHGAVSWGTDLVRTGWWMDMLEAYCRTVILATNLGELSALSPHDAAALRRAGEKSSPSQ